MKIFTDLAQSWHASLLAIGIIGIGGGIGDGWIQTLLYDLAFLIFGIGAGIKMQRQCDSTRSD